MLRSRSLIIAAATAALAVGALGAPAAAANPRLAFVNGIAGKTVDVCVGNNEVKSRVKYGAWFQREFAPGNRVVRFRNASPGRCRGNLLGLESLVLAADDDLTLVGTRFPDKVVVFDNTPVPVLATTWWRSLRHAADVGEVVFALESDSIQSPAALPDSFTKGEHATTTGSNWSSFGLAATLLEGGSAIADKHFMVVEGRRLEIILVGNKRSNARFVAINRRTLAP